VHGCARTSDPPGSLQGGEICRDDAECRSNSCVRIGPGRDGNICYDYCGSDSYCPANGTVCRLRHPGIDGRCWPDASLGDGALGESCTSDLSCDHGFCADVAGDRMCSEACCTSTDCPDGFVCGLNGEQADTPYAYPEPNAPACANNNDCPQGLVCTGGGSCARILTDTSPMCLPAGGGDLNRPGGAACARNGQCRSNFCGENLGVCVEPCCHDGVCPQGLTCELQVVETTDDRVSSARVCMNLSTEDVILRR
jgi:hypothetical protein